MHRGWRTTRLKYVAEINREVVPEATSPEMEFRYIDVGNVTQGNMDTSIAPTRFSDAPSRARRLAEAGDTVVSTVRTYLRAVAAVPATTDTLVFSTGFAVFHPADTVVPRYLSWYLQGDEFVSRVEASSVGVSYPATTAAELSSMVVRLPPFDEQRAIADYLDRETQKIDELITEQRGLIKTLRERRKAVVTRAVTTGLRDHRIMQQVDEPTLGQIPADWQVRRIKSIGRAIIGLTYVPEDIVAEGEGRLVLRSGNIQNGKLSFENNVYVSRKLPKDLEIKLDDIVICARNGTSDLIGKNAIATQEVVGETWGAFMAVLRTDINYYLQWVLNSEIFRAQTGLFSTSTINQLTSRTLHNLKFGLPPTDEQKEISAYLDEQTSRIDELISESEDLIALSQERRAALITAAVTGQIDVRTAA